MKKINLEIVNIAIFGAMIIAITIYNYTVPIGDDNDTIIMYYDEPIDNGGGDDDSSDDSDSDSDSGGNEDKKKKKDKDKDK